MGRLRSKRRSMKIKVGLKRRKKLAKLRKLYLEAKNITEKEGAFTRALKLAPWLTKKDFLSSAEKKDQNNE